MPPCCERLCADVYRELLTCQGASDSPVMRQEIIRACEELTPLLRPFFHGGVQVARLKAWDAAQEFPQECACHAKFSVIIIADSFLFLVWRIQMILASLIESWDTSEDGRTRVAFRDPCQADEDQMRIASEMYLGQKVVSEAGIEELLRPQVALDPVVRNRLRILISIAELWVVLHELSHSIWRASASRNRMDVQNAIMLFTTFEFAELELSTKQLRSWSEEIHMDLLAVDSFILALVERRESHGIPRRPAQLDSAFMLLGAMRLVTETMRQIEERFDCVSNWGSSRSDHPPSNLRYQIIQRWIFNRLKITLPEEVLGLANTIDHLSELLRSRF